MEAVGGWLPRTDPPGDLPRRRGSLPLRWFFGLLFGVRRDGAVALDDTSGVDYAGNGAGRIGHKVADRAGLVLLRAEESISFVIEQAAPDIAVIRVSGELDMLTTPLLESRLRESFRWKAGR